MCPLCSRPKSQCRCGTVYVRREVKGRGGKTVTVVQGLNMSPGGLETLAGEMKKRYGTGGTVKDGVILIQGDRCKAILEFLRQKGYSAKQAGG